MAVRSLVASGAALVAALQAAGADAGGAAAAQADLEAAATRMGFEYDALQCILALPRALPRALSITLRPQPALFSG